MLAVVILVDWSVVVTVYVLKYRWSLEGNTFTRCAPNKMISVVSNGTHSMLVACCTMVESNVSSTTVNVGALLMSNTYFFPTSKSVIEGSNVYELLASAVTAN